LFQCTGGPCIGANAKAPSSPLQKRQKTVRTLSALLLPGDAGGAAASGTHRAVAAVGVQKSPLCTASAASVPRGAPGAEARFLRSKIDSSAAIVCVYYCRTYYKAVCGGGRGAVKDMRYEVRRAEACVDEWAHHALVNERKRDSV
jgi:hypothetical protein